MNADGRPDLLVGNETGDLLILLGDGMGNFAAPRPTGRSVPLIVGQFDNSPGEDFIFASESFDRVSVAFNQSIPTTAIQDAQDGLLAPDAVLLTDLNHDFINDLAVANSGGNNVFVYLGSRDAQGGMQFGQDPSTDIFSFEVATAPAALTDAGDLNGDGRNDLFVAHRGSNVVKLLLSDTSGGFNMTNNLTFTTSGLAPSAMLLKDVVRADGSAGTDGFLDLLVTNSQASPGSANGSIDVFASNGAGGFFDSTPSSTTPVGGLPVGIIDLGTQLATINFGSNSLTLLNSFANGQFQTQELFTRATSPSSALAGDFNGDGATDLIVGSSGDGLLELFLDDGGELLTEGFLDTDLNISAMALSVIQGSRVFYVTSDGVEQAFAFSLDDFAGEERGTVADLPSDSVAIIAALVTGSADISAADFFTGQDGETVNFGELLFFSESGASPEGAGGGDSSSVVLEQVREFFRQFVQQWSVTFGTSDGGGWQVIVSGVQGVLETAGELPIAGFNPFAGWQTVVSQLQLPEVGEQLVATLVKAGAATLNADAAVALGGAGGQGDGSMAATLKQAAEQAGKSAAMSALANEPEEEDDAALLDAAFLDGCPELADELFQESSTWRVRPDADWQDCLAASLLACGLSGTPVWTSRDASRREDRGRAARLRRSC